MKQRTKQWKSMFACLLASATLLAAEHRAAADRMPVPDRGAAKCSFSPGGMKGSAAAPCAECPNQCQSHVNACKDGSVKECYLAAACLCQCNLDAGGCGSDKEALRQCVEDNNKNARALEQ